MASKQVSLTTPSREGGKSKENTLSKSLAIGAISLTVLLLAVIIANIGIFQAKESTRCEDLHEMCKDWADQGECKANSNYMSVYCSQSCEICRITTTPANNQSSPPKNSPVSSESSQEQTIEASLLPYDNNDYNEENDVDDYDEEGLSNESETKDRKELNASEKGAANECADLEEACGDWAAQGYCEKNHYWMHSSCKRSCGLCPQCSNAHASCDFWASHGECENNPNYMLSNCQRSCKVCGENTIPSTVGSATCKDKLNIRDCAARKAHGDCDHAPGWMTVFCGKTCGRCDLLMQDARCVPEVFNDTSYRYENALEKGDVTRIFTKVLNEYPSAELVLQPPKGPWVIKLPNFITEIERSRILSHTLPHVKRSTDQGEFSAEGIQEQVVSSGRTSSNAWCQEECMHDPVVANLTQRISSLVTVPVKNFESFQVLQYKIGQKYDSHHDSSEDTRHDLSGPRILTFFIYLSDVQEGGETYFDKLGVKVKPQRNMAIMWPSVLDDSPNKVDWRTTHAALPVIKGEKLAANIWMHLRDFSTPNKWGCTGAFEES